MKKKKKKKKMEDMFLGVIGCMVVLSGTGFWVKSGAW